MAFVNLPFFGPQCDRMNHFRTTAVADSTKSKKNSFIPLQFSPFCCRCFIYYFIFKCWGFAHVYASLFVMGFAYYTYGSYAYLYSFQWFILCWSLIWKLCRADCRLAPSQWETSLQSNVVSHCLGANLESALLCALQNPCAIVINDYRASSYDLQLWASPWVNKWYLQTLDCSTVSWLRGMEGSVFCWRPPPYRSHDPETR